ncbi:LysE family translocator [Natronospirillum operosum]|uniref:LysE family translocator n=1 Tax=Natronospirillum operosum TaxID=2759953 RepID=A0A4Z0WF78_9GAMM|nr:LysE family translocator [Natronospirillum operosum]TGG94092.1 LysE family translocator [Natronospirillum operosum]
MLNPALLSAFIPTFFFVSITPGLCMTLAMTLGITVGVRRAFWMMWGEMLGVATVVIAAVAGIAALLLTLPELFTALRWVGGLYLMFLGVQMWRSRGRMAIPDNLDDAVRASRTQLFVQGYVTAVANPKGWAFTIALLPPFLDASHPLVPQLMVLLALILVIEFVCLLIYSSGGKMMRVFLLQATNVRVMNRIAGTLMLGVGVWLAWF